MKICFITITLYEVGGVGRVLGLLASGLAKKHDVTIVTFDNPKKADLSLHKLPENIHVEFQKDFYKKHFFNRVLHNLNKWTGLLKKINSDALFCNVYFPKDLTDFWIKYIKENDFDVVVGVQGNIACRLAYMSDKLDCLTIGWQHNSYEAYFETPGNYYFNQEEMHKKYMPKLDHCVVLNEVDAEKYKTRLGIQATAIYNPKTFVSEEKAALENKRFIAVGGLRPAKGFDMLIDAFAEFSRSNSEWVLDIFGEGDDRKKLQAKIRKYALEERVKLRGNTKEIKKELLSSSVFLLSSRWEGMPMVILEALEIGLPIIAFDIPAMVPLVSNGEEGYIISSFDTKAFSGAMKDLAGDFEKRASMGKKSVQKSKRFDLENILPEWEKLFAGEK